MSTERSTAEILRAARERISDPERWTQGPPAVYADGRSHPEWGAMPDACAWCAVGSVWTEHVVDRGCRPLSPWAPEDILDRAAQEQGFTCAIDLNETADHEAVLALYGRAIELAEAESK